MTHYKSIRFSHVRSLTHANSVLANYAALSIIPVFKPTDAELLEAFNFLGLDSKKLTCVYCGDLATEYDHLFPVIKNSRPTGYFTELANCVPCCGKCNQSKGNKDYATWMRSDAPLSPATRGVLDIEFRIDKLDKYCIKYSRQKLHEDVLYTIKMQEYYAQIEKCIAEIALANNLSRYLKNKLNPLFPENSNELI